MAWWEYVQRIAGTSSPSEIGRQTGLGPSSVSRWVVSSPKPDSVRQFAHAYHRPVLEAFVAADFLTEEEAGVTKVPADLYDVATDALLAELRRRTAR